MTIFNIGVSGLNAAQSALNATSNNISNVYTPGYNRELIILNESSTGGVKVTDVQRQFNSFISERLNTASGSLSSLTTYKNQISQIDNLLADPEAGLAPLIQKFFGSLGDLAGAPAEPAAREGVLGNASSMAAQFQSFDGYLHDMQRSVNGQLINDVAHVNNLASQIAALNKEIAMSKAATGTLPNALLNQRDYLVGELSKSVEVKVNVQDGGAYNVSIGNGQPLVAGDRTFQLEAVASAADPERIVVGYRDSSGNLIEFGESTFRSGSIGGLLSFRKESLDKAQAQLGQIALTMAQTFNEQHRQGIDLAGEPGENFFSVGSPLSYSNTRNTGDGIMTVEVTDARQLLATGYDVSFNGTEYFAVRRDNGERVDVTFDAAENTLSFGGMEVTITGTPEAGDRFRVNPVQRGAQDFQVMINDIGKIAAAQSADDGDNRNALALQGMQSMRLVGNNASFSQAYGAMISDSGNRAAVVNANLAAQQGLTDQLKAMQQSESGVNLDEEAANLIKYQQFYQANAKVIEAGMTILETILSLRR
ncbi:flagellar hook-associated protein FlgK [Aliidiomarina halalkaliphila]|uniref:Flagellar hook-associated protein 1 n=1 Tax=Aliidiomarina halalkaliphila TaxID=2593535 RepID=A0A552X191_9GAMM|nr:flagellar hook-associated protein FlgK [Aliidiomarina halalkaliphila]TRW48811.1 flagellar hook-associated protein FlgK [Aliidiomarina halalkaliphila]